MQVALPFLTGLLWGGLALPVASAQEEGNPLQPGPHAVGFQSYVLLDTERTYRTAWDDGDTYGRHEMPRPILVNLWYPALQDNAPAPMPYEQYFALAPEQQFLTAWARSLAQYAADVVSSETLALDRKDFDINAKRVWERMMSMPTWARPQAKALPGPFPFVVFHSGNGSSYEDNAWLCEYLASHGYVVLGSAYPKADGSSWAIDSREDSVLDMEFLARHAASLRQVGDQPGAFGGHSAGAQATLRARMRADCSAQSIFLLDSTLDYYTPAIPTFRYLMEPVTEQADAFVGPVLVTAGHEAFFALCDNMVRATRSYVTYPELSHNEYISQGVQRLMMLRWLHQDNSSPEIRQELAREQEVRRQYVALCETVRLFLDATLKEEAKAFDQQCAVWAKNMPGGPEPFAVRVPQGESQAEAWTSESGHAPMPRQLHLLLAEQGMDGFLAALEAHVNDHPRGPVYTSGMLMGSLLFDLAEANRIEEAQRLHQWLLEHGLDTQGTFRFLGFMSNLVGATQDARHILDMALLVDPENEKTQKERQALNKEETTQ